MHASVRLPFGDVIADCLRVLFRHWHDLPRLVALPTLLVFGIHEAKGLLWAELLVAYPPQAGDDPYETFRWASQCVSWVALLLQSWIVAGVLVGWLRLLKGGKGGFFAGFASGRSTLRCWGLTLCIALAVPVLRNVYFAAIEAGRTWGLDLFAPGLPQGLWNLFFWLNDPIVLLPFLPLYLGYVRILRNEPGNPLAILRVAAGYWWRIAVILSVLVAPVLLAQFMFFEFGILAVHYLGGGSWALDLVAILLRHYQVAVLVTGALVVDAWLQPGREGGST